MAAEWPKSCKDLGHPSCSPFEASNSWQGIAPLKRLNLLVDVDIIDCYNFRDYFGH
jgi:hypothetical protein